MISEIKELNKLHKRFIRKLRSDNGASLSMALLLFLICAAIGAIVLTAATASAGRLSSLAEMEQRYYSVSSAVELLENKLCKTPIEVNVKREVTVKDDLTYGGSSTEYVFTVNGKNVLEKEDETKMIDSFLSFRAMHFVFDDYLDGANPSDSDKDNAFRNRQSDAEYGTFYIRHEKGQNETENQLDVTVDWVLKTDGTIELKVSDGPVNNKYTLVLTLIPTVVESEKNVIDVITENGAQYRTNTTTKTTKITWEYGGIVKEVAGQ